MAVRKAKKKRRDTAKLSEMLAPLEERQPEAKAPGSQNHDGAIVVDSSKLKVPADFVESEEERTRILGLEPVVLTILLVMLAFIGFIAYLISIEPPKP